MKVKILLAASLAIAVSVPVLAAEEGTAKPEIKEKKICRSENVTGSLTAKRRICLTKAEWDQLAQESKDKIDRFTSRSSGNPGSGSNPLSPQ